MADRKRRKLRGGNKVHVYLCVCVRAGQDQGVKEVRCRSTCCMDHVCDPVVKHRLISARAHRPASTHTHVQHAAIGNETDAARGETSAGASCKITCKTHACRRGVKKARRADGAGRKVEDEEDEGGEEAEETDQGLLVS